MNIRRFASFHPQIFTISYFSGDAVGGADAAALNWAKVLMDKFDGSVAAHCGPQIAVECEGVGDGDAHVERRSDSRGCCGDEQGRGRRGTATRVEAGALMELIMGSYYSVPLVPHHCLALGSRTLNAPGPFSLGPSLASLPSSHLAAGLLSLAAAPHKVGTDSSPSFDVNLEPGQLHSPSSLLLLLLLLSSSSDKPILIWKMCCRCAGVVPTFLVCTAGDEALLGSVGRRLSVESLKRLHIPWNEPDSAYGGEDGDVNEVLELPLDTSRLPMLGPSQGVLVHRLLVWLDQFG